MHYPPRKVQRLCKHLFAEAKISRDDGVVQILPVVLQVVRLPIPIHILPTEFIKPIEVRLQHMLRYRITERVIPVIQ